MDYQPLPLRPNIDVIEKTLRCPNFVAWSGVDVNAAGDHTRMSGAVFPTPALHAARGTYASHEHGIFYFGCDGSAGISLLNDHVGVAASLPRLPEIVDFFWRMVDGIESCAIWAGQADHAQQFRAMFEGSNLDPYLYRFTKHAAFRLSNEPISSRWAAHGEPISVGNLSRPTQEHVADTD